MSLDTIRYSSYKIVSLHTKIPLYVQNKNQSSAFLVNPLLSKYRNFVSPVKTLVALERWMKDILFPASGPFRFMRHRTDIWPALRCSKDCATLLSIPKQVLQSMIPFYGEDPKNEEMVASFFHRFFELLAQDQNQENKLPQSEISRFIFGPIPPPRLEISSQDQVVMKVSSEPPEDIIPYTARNLGQKLGFASIPPYLSQEVFFDSNNNRLDPRSFCFSVIDLTLCPQHLEAAYIQNKGNCLTDCARKNKGGGIMIIKGIPSDNTINWLIQRDAQRIPSLPMIEVAVCLELDKESSKSIWNKLDPRHKFLHSDFPCFYLITIKKAEQFRWKKNNFARFTDYAKRIIIKPRSPKPLAGSQTREIKRVYSEIKELIKENLTFVPAYTIFKQINKVEISSCSNLTELLNAKNALFWELVRESDTYSRLTPLSISIQDPDDKITEYAKSHFLEYLDWLILAANGSEDKLPDIVRDALKQTVAINRLKRLDPSKHEESHFSLPSESVVNDFLETFIPKFKEILHAHSICQAKNTQPIFRLSFPPIIDDYLSGKMQSASKNSQHLSSLTPEALTTTFKDQINFSYDLELCILRFSQGNGKVQVSNHMVGKKSFGSLEDLAKEYERCFFWTYFMIQVGLPLKKKDDSHITELEKLAERIAAFNRGQHVYKVWADLNKTFPQLSKNKAHMQITQMFAKNFKKKADTPISDNQQLNQYFTALYSEITVGGVKLNTIIGWIKNLQSKEQRTSVSIDEVLQPFRPFLESLNTLNLVDAYQPLLYPLFLENMLGEESPITAEDRLLFVVYPPADLRHYLVKYIYIVDHEGQVKISPEMSSGKRKGQRISHSELAGWAPVLAAGELYFGKLEENKWECAQINNGSGHYAPEASKSLPTAKQAIEAALSNTDIGIPEGGIPIRNVLLPGVPSHSFLRQ